MTKFLEPRMFFGPPRMAQTPNPDCKHDKGAVFRVSNWFCKACGAVLRDKKKQPKDKFQAENQKESKSK